MFEGQIRPLRKAFTSSSYESCKGCNAWSSGKLPCAEAGITELVRFVEGLADDEAAVANACTESYSNGMVEGFNAKVKLIKRNSYGQAGFPLLQRRVLLHPAAGEAFDKEQRLRSSRGPTPAEHPGASPSR